MPSTPSTRQRGSALLIVLGLLAFLMISAVAFSISMRTERSAAAAYRRNLLARELLSTAFADARATVEYALVSQRDKANFNRADTSTYTVEALAPFKYNGADRYARLITSRNSDAQDATETYDAEDEPIAYLLDDKVMSHVPPYVAYTVYQALEQQVAEVNPDVKREDSSGRYYLDWSAGWKPIYASIPEMSVDVNTSGNTVDTAIVGRMAWAVVNLSDALDINAVGSASTKRGLGLTGSELAFGRPSSSSITEGYDLLESSDSETAELDLPTFCSNADLAQYAARYDDSSLLADNGDISPYSWQEAVATQEDGFYSPFAVYGFWPNRERKSESGTRTSTDSGSTETKLSCNDITATALSSSASATATTLIDAVDGIIGGSGAGLRLAQMLHDYLDADNEPTSFQNNSDLYRNAQPTVEAVPMLSEVSYGAQGWDKNGENLKQVEDAIKKALEDIKPDLNGITSAADVPTNLGDKTLKISLPALSQQVGLRTYFPGAAFASGSYHFAPEGFIGVVAAATQNNKAVKLNQEAITNKLTVSGSLSVDGGSASAPLFEASDSTPTIQLKGAELSLEIDGKDIFVANPKASSDGDTTTQEFTLNLLVDFMFRVVGTSSGGPAIDLCPAIALKEYTSDNYPTSISARNSTGSNGLARVDTQYFRVTRPLSISFKLEWEIKEQKDDAGNVTGLEANLNLASGKLNLKVSSPFSSELDLNGTKWSKAQATGAPSCQMLSPESGTWYAIDPRYNWISPMHGCSDSPTDYVGSGLSNVYPAFSSVHWLFQADNDGRITSGSETPSDAQTAYADKNSDLVPFSWGLKVEDIRYGYNDTDQLLLPAELTFLPVPYASNTWHPNQASYNSNTFSSYYASVAKASFFRTLPAVDLQDSVLDYDKYTKLASLLRGFGGDNFPEEHRGIVHAFAGQDNYLLAQQLRQFAMLGIPSSIKQAAYVTYQRLKSAEGLKRVSAGMLDEDLKSLAGLQATADTTARYDDFVANYLFPLPKTSGGQRTNAKDWRKSQVLYEGKNGVPTRPKTLDFIVQDGDDGTSFADRLTAYNNKRTTAAEKLGQNDMNTLLAVAKECFGDRQQLFLYILRADFIAYNSTNALASHKPRSSARAVALVWRDAYGELPDRVVYYQLIP